MAPHITNIVATFEIKNIIDILDYILNDGPFKRCLYRLNGSKCMVYPSGKVVITGSKTIEDAHLVADLCSFSYGNIDASNFTIRTISATCDLKKICNLEKIYYACQRDGIRVLRDVEIFPALRVYGHAVTASIFHTEK